MIEAPTLNDGYTTATGHRPKETPTGYKHTEVGVIPEDWELSRIGGLARVLRGASPRPIDDPKWFDDESSTGWLRIADVTATDKYLNATCQKLSQAGIANSRLVLSDSLVMSICATVGKPIITRMNVCIHDGFVVFNNLQTEREYLYYVLSSLEPKWSKQGQTGSQMNLNTGIINSTPIPIPPPPEQLAIAEALSDVDKLLESLDALIAKKRAIKRATTQQLLTGETRLPGYGGEWRTIRLGDLGRWRGGMTPLTSVPHYWIGGTVPWLTSSDVRQGQLNDSSENITKQAVKETGIPVIRSNSTIVVVRSGILRRFLPVANNSIPVAINQDLRALEPGPLHSPQYLVHALMGVEKYLLRDCLKAGTTVESIDSTWFQGFKLSMPTLDEQDAIAAVLSDMDTEISALKTRLKKICAIKDGMMEQLLTGRVRLVEQVCQPDNEQVAP